ASGLSTSCAAGPMRAQSIAKEQPRDDLGANRSVLRFPCRRASGLRVHRAGHLAYHQAPPHLLAGPPACRLSLSRRLLPGAAFLRCAAAGLLRGLHAVRLVALVARRAPGG